MKHKVNIDDEALSSVRFYCHEFNWSEDTFLFLISIEVIGSICEPEIRLRHDNGSGIQHGCPQYHEQLRRRRRLPGRYEASVLLLSAFNIFYSCPRGQVIVGWQIRQFPYGGPTVDDVGSVNVRAYCGSPFSMDRSSYTILESENSYPCTLDILCEPLARES